MSVSPSRENAPLAQSAATRHLALLTNWSTGDEETDDEAARIFDADRGFCGRRRHGGPGARPGGMAAAPGHDRGAVLGRRLGRPAGPAAGPAPAGEIRRALRGREPRRS